eukprot:scaffold3827_cov179-Cylindrotheca_fusiformis.AAC.37
MVDATERLAVLLNLETDFYDTSDYLDRMQQMAQEASRPSSGIDCDGSFPPSPKKRKSEDGSQAEAVSSSASEASTGSVINKQWREKICEWAYQVIDHFNLNREIVCIAMSHMDRYLASYPTPVDKNMFQLLAMTCLYLSIKLNEYKHLLIPGSKSTMGTILQLSRGYFTLQEMQKMEYEVLQRLQWHVHPPTPQVFVKHFLYFVSLEDAETHDLAQFMAELSVMDYFFVNYKPSEVAIASILNAMDRMSFGYADFAMSALQRSGFDTDSENVRECRDRLERIYCQATQSDIAAEVEETPRKASMQANGTVSPVSVLAEPTPSP